MNKQELIMQLESFQESENPNTWKSGYNAGISESIGLVEQLDEPQKVKVPVYVAELLDYYRESTGVDLLALLITFKDWYYRTDKDSMHENAIEWLVKRPEKYMRAWINGYEVEEEPRWVVRVGEKLLFKEYADNEFPVFVIDDQPGAIEQAENFELKGIANNVQKEVGGTVEKV